ncbi:helix-turn-helix domain-containing protein [Kribbella sp. CA-294648]|uniref:helix-turn-helix domain-containing protein n=1 Tax=Kribbella sp. CA-294648 TaxID=3239948 RepID=UPI003D8DE803
MDQQLIAVGERIRSQMPPGLSQRRLAGLVDMTPDALSRALNGQRGFSSIELARIADSLGVDVYWLITGREDPQRVDIAARHVWDPVQAERVNPGREADDKILERVVAVYRDAYPDGPPRSPDLPADPDALRGRLGANFVRHFAGQIEAAFAIDVIRIPELSTDYSLRIGGRSVILLVSTPNWFRNNWSVAHELGHLVLGHHAGQGVEKANEQPADDFAARLLLPEQRMREIKWSQLSEIELAEFVWEAGVSTEALRNRLRKLRIRLSAKVTAALGQPTQHLLRRHLPSTASHDPAVDPVIEREAESTGRTFPLRLLADLSQRVRAGQADPAALAWLLDVPLDEIDFPEPDEDAASQQYEEVLAARPSAAAWKDRLAADPTNAAPR